MGLRIIAEGVRLLLVLIVACFWLPAVYSEPGIPYVLRFASPDPFVWRDSENFYLVTTNQRGKNVPLFRSIDLQNWIPLGDALPDLPDWAQKGFTWAPEIIRFQGSYWLFYTSRMRKSGFPCIGLARAATPEGPYHDDSESPMICMDDKGGAIDASPFVDNGKLYLLWKANGNRLRIRTAIMLAEIDPIQRVLKSDLATLIENDAEWEGRSVEAPSLIKYDGRYYLFYSGAMFHTRKYAVGYASADSINGPYFKYRGNPIISSTHQRIAPGHQSIFKDGEERYWIAYHAYPGQIAGRKRTTEFARLLPPKDNWQWPGEDVWKIVPPSSAH